MWTASFSATAFRPVQVLLAPMRVLAARWSGGRAAGQETQTGAYRALTRNTVTKKVETGAEKKVVTGTLSRAHTETALAMKNVQNQI